MNLLKKMGANFCDYIISSMNDAELVKNQKFCLRIVIFKMPHLLDKQVGNFYHRCERISKDEGHEAEDFSDRKC